MNNQITYKAAKEVALTIEEHFAHHIMEAKKSGFTGVVYEPKAERIEVIIDTAFWASLRREEGRSPKISIALLPPSQAVDPLLFEYRHPLNPESLTKIAPGFERPGIHLGAWFENDNFYIWGATLKIPNFCFVLDVPEPGLLVVKHRRMEGVGKFSNVAVLIGDEIKIVDEKIGSMPDCPTLLMSLLDFTSPSSWNNPINVLLQLAVSMRAHKRGGTLLVVPSSSSKWRGSIRKPIQHSVSPSFTGLSALMKTEENSRANEQWQLALTREVEIVAGLTALDGAIIINDQYDLLAFGSKIQQLNGSVPVEEILASEPILGGGPVVVHPAQKGGTRHLSAAQFVHDQRESIALVASQDGNFTVYSWSECDRMVHAHRIDSLLI